MNKLQEIINKLRYIEGYIDGLCWAVNDDLADALDSISRDINDVTSVIEELKK